MWPRENNCAARTFSPSSRCQSSARRLSASSGVEANGKRASSILRRSIAVASSRQNPKKSGAVHCSPPRFRRPTAAFSNVPRKARLSARQSVRKADQNASSLSEVQNSPQPAQHLPHETQHSAAPTDDRAAHRSGKVPNGRTNGCAKRRSGGKRAWKKGGGDERSRGKRSGAAHSYIYKACRDGHTGRVRLESGSRQPTRGGCFGRQSRNSSRTTFST